MSHTRRGGRRIAAGLALLLLLGAGLPGVAPGILPGGAFPGIRDAAAADRMVTVIVRLRDQAPIGGANVVARLRARATVSQAGIRAALRARIARGSVARATPLWIINAVSVTGTRAAIAALAARPDVAGITPDATDIVALPVAPAALPPEPNLVQVGAPAIWAGGATGQGVVVASLDSGVDLGDPDLAASWRGGSNSWFDPYGEHPAAPIDLGGHGTATMGVMVGGTATGTAIGVAPGARWIAARIFDDRGRATATAIHQAFQWVLDPDGNPATADAPAVVNNSWSFGGTGCNVEFRADVQALRAAGIAPVFAAGNFGPGTGSSVSPANYPESIAVGSVDGADLVDPPSSRGPSACGTAPYPALVAPGVGIVTADRGGFPQVATGTSLAAPHVSGAIALLGSMFPGRSPLDVAGSLIATARDLGPAGTDTASGAGRIDLVAAAGFLALPPLPPPPLVACSVAVEVPRLAGGGSFPVAITVAAGQITARWLRGGVGEGSLAIRGGDPKRTLAIRKLAGRTIQVSTKLSADGPVEVVAQTVGAARPGLIVIRYLAQACAGGSGFVPRRRP